MLLIKLAVNGSLIKKNGQKKIYKPLSFFLIPDFIPLFLFPSFFSFSLFVSISYILARTPRAWKDNVRVISFVLATGATSRPTQYEEVCIYLQVAPSLKKTIGISLKKSSSAYTCMQEA